MKKSESRLLPDLITALDTVTHDELSEWEQGFLSDMESRSDDYELSDKQVRVIIRIHDKLSERGLL